jgi:hypothetical protein
MACGVRISKHALGHFPIERPSTTLIAPFGESVESPPHQPTSFDLPAPYRREETGDPKNQKNKRKPSEMKLKFQLALVATLAAVSSVASAIKVDNLAHLVNTDGSVTRFSATSVLSPIT